MTAWARGSVPGLDTRKRDCEGILDGNFSDTHIQNQHTFMNCYRLEVAYDVEVAHEV